VHCESAHSRYIRENNFVFELDPRSVGNSVSVSAKLTSSVVGGVKGAKKLRRIVKSRANVSDCRLLCRQPLRLVGCSGLLAIRLDSSAL
jgi:hypothetical protein